MPGGFFILIKMSAHLPSVQNWWCPALGGCQVSRIIFSLHLCAPQAFMVGWGFFLLKGNATFNMLLLILGNAALLASNVLSTNKR